MFVSVFMLLVVCVCLYCFCCFVFDVVVFPRLVLLFLVVGVVWIRLFLCVLYGYILVFCMQWCALYIIRYLQHGHCVNLILNQKKL